MESGILCSVIEEIPIRKKPELIIILKNKLKVLCSFKDALSNAFFYLILSDLIMTNIKKKDLISVIL